MANSDLFVDLTEKWTKKGVTIAIEIFGDDDKNIVTSIIFKSSLDGTKKAVQAFSTKEALIEAHKITEESIGITLLNKGG